MSLFEATLQPLFHLGYARLDLAPTRCRPMEHDPHPDDPASGPSPEGAAPPDLESTLALLELARRGDRAALDRLCARYIPRLRRWARGRLPSSARDLLETDDLIQEILIRTVRRVGQFEPRTIGEFHAYLRRALTNRIRDEVRRVRNVPETAELFDEEESPGLSPIEVLIGREDLARYEAALKRLRPEDQEAIVARIEMGCSYQEVAETLGKPSPDAARMAVTRAIVRLAEEMRDER